MKDLILSILAEQEVLPQDKCAQVSSVVGKVDPETIPQRTRVMYMTSERGVIRRCWMDIILCEHGMLRFDH